LEQGCHVLAKKWHPSTPDFIGIHAYKTAFGWKMDVARGHL